MGNSYYVFERQMPIKAEIQRMSVFPTTPYGPQDNLNQTPLNSMTTGVLTDAEINAL